MLFSLYILTFYVLQPLAALPNYASSLQLTHITVLGDHRKMRNRKVFEKTELSTSPLKTKLSRPMLPQLIGWTESLTPSLAETPWPPCAIDFSISPCLHFLCLSCLLYCNLSQVFPLQSITDTVNKLFVATETCVFENGSSHLPSVSEEPWILQLSLTGHVSYGFDAYCHSYPPHCPLLHLRHVVLRTGHPIPVEASQMHCKEEGLLPMSYRINSC